uniref:Uncharacterized protein n=1 Tax=Leersia perrieri TaxID=77586 RepID=A0A0D9WXE7_9ORYZ
MFNNSEAPHQNYQQDRVSFPSVQVFVIGYVCMESPTMIPFSGPFADITNVIFGSDVHVDICTLTLQKQSLQWGKLSGVHGRISH